MIGYDNLRISDLDFYWSGSTFLVRHNRKWKTARYSGASAENAHTVQQAARSGGTLLFSLDEGNLIHVSPNAPFISPDWITYRPELGYLITPSGALVWTQHGVPRRRAKGIQSADISIRRVAGAVSGVSSTTVLNAVAKRMNSGLPPEHMWSKLARGLARKGKKCQAEVLSPTLALFKSGNNRVNVNSCGNTIGSILYKGTPKYTPAKAVTAVADLYDRTIIKKLIGGKTDAQSAA
jgi:hypothetical protein